MSIAVIAIFLLTSCGSDNKDTSYSDNSNKPLKEKIEDLEDQGKLPKLDRSSDIAGPDENSNGVRDDIEAYITKNYPDEKQKKALFQFAKATQAKLLVDTTDMIVVKETNRNRSRALHILCV